MWSINYLECASPFHTPGLHSILDSFFFLSEKKRPKEVPGSGKSFHGPENNQNQRMSSVEILTKKDFRRHATERNYCELSCRQVWQWTREKTC